MRVLVQSDHERRLGQRRRLVPGVRVPGQSVCLPLGVEAFGDIDEPLRLEAAALAHDAVVEAERRRSAAGFPYFEGGGSLGDDIEAFGIAVGRDEDVVAGVANFGRVVTKEELLKAVWPESFVEESNLSQHIFTLRKALGDKAGCIATIAGRGYQFTVDVQSTPHPDAASTAGEGGEDYIVQHIRERTLVVIEETSQVAAATPVHDLFVRRIPGRWIAWGMVAALVASISGNYLWKRFAKPPELRKVLVGEFLNLAGDPSLDHNLKNDLEIGLGQSPYIQLMGAGEEQTALTSMEKATDTPLLGDTALEVCRRSNYQALLRGKIESSSDRFGYRLSIDVLNCASGTTLTTYHADALNKDALLNTLDGLAGRVRRELGESPQSIEQFDVPLTNATTFSFEALQDYNKGTALGSQGKLPECIAYLQKAVDLDPKFAMAQANLGTAYFNLGDRAKAGVLAKTAFDLSGNVSQLEKFYLRNNYYYMTLDDLDAAEKNQLEWTHIYPNDATGWAELADTATQLGNYQEAIVAGEQELKTTVARSPTGYERLSRAYMRANRNADAKRIIAEAQAQNMDAPRLHWILFEMAIAERDRQSIEREIAWSKGKPEQYRFLESHAILAADEGKAHESEALFKSAIANAAHEVSPGFADEMLLDEVRVLAELGRTPRVAEMLRQVKEKSSLEYAVAATAAGNDAAGEAYLKKPAEPPFGAIELHLLFPELKALLALDHHDPSAAVAALAQAIPYELARCEAIEVRGQAYLAASQGDKAELEYKKLIANPGLEDPPLPRTTLAHLGLARAYALEGKKTESRDEYEKLFALWKDADVDLPVLKQARSEYAHIQ
jgi:tetratricopeptide (TPR) repeat protein